MTRTLRAHAWLNALFVISRAALVLAGLRFSFSLDWMWLSDPGDLRERWLETLWYFHAFPPGMNALTGVLLKIDEANAAACRGEFGFENERVRAVAAPDHVRRLRGSEAPTAVAFVADQRCKARVRIEAWPAHPIDRTVAVDQRRRFAVTDHCVVFKRRSHASPSARQEFWLQVGNAWGSS